MFYIKNSTRVSCQAKGFLTILPETSNMARYFLDSYTLGLKIKKKSIFDIYYVYFEIS